MEKATDFCRNFFGFLLRCSSVTDKSALCCCVKPQIWQKSDFSKKLWLNFRVLYARIYEYHYGRSAPFRGDPSDKENLIMPHTIAVAGKGGVGKTTTCGMLIDYLCKKNRGPVLVVDADANSNLNEVLGVEVETSLGAIREEMAQAELKGTIPAGMTKADYAEFKFNSALIEEDDFDMLVMGRTQGKGCYCYVNGVLKTQVDKYAKNYSYIVMDNEAGLEHVARGTLPHVDTMLLISDCSRRGVQAVARIAEMINEMELKPVKMGLIINRAPNGELSDGIREEIERHGLTLFGVLPQDEAVYHCDCNGEPSSKLPDNDPMKIALKGIMQSIGL
jgi:CO dehydrogenase maturation factor